MSLRLLVDSDEFVNSFAEDVSRSRESVYVQVMTFEADDAGQTIAGILQQSPAADRRLLVDRYIDVMISDRLYRSPRNRRDAALQREVRETFELLSALPRRGISTRLANPVGPLLLRMVARDHVKIYAVDRRVAYLGGLNISDHNFAWHDSMLRIEDAAVAGFLADRFLDSWNGRRTSGLFQFSSLDLLFFDGRSNQNTFQVIIDLLDSASESIWIESPYVSFPLFSHLRRAVRRGVQVDVVSPGKNNKPLMDSYTVWEARRSGVALHHLPYGMTHLKACLIDGQTLLIGSSNLDYLAATVQRELIAVVRDDDLVQDFIRRVQKVDMEAARPWEGRPSQSSGMLSGALLHAAVKTAAFAARLTSAADRLQDEQGTATHDEALAMRAPTSDRRQPRERL